ncbi:hypothetical protein [Streptomyces sp. NPDC016845]|uniref:hypothetical protein n=1 Tax=Streptomyces sp. NPDC016845 TaxID=3364972 RepID=UPI0037B74A2E
MDTTHPAAARPGPSRAILVTFTALACVDVGLGVGAVARAGGHLTPYNSTATGASAALALLLASLVILTFAVKPQGPTVPASRATLVTISFLACVAAGFVAGIFARTVGDLRLWSSGAIGAAVMLALLVASVKVMAFAMKEEASTT